MINVTLDMNCIIDLEVGKGAAPYIRELIQLHKEKKINLRVVAISASERKPDGTYASNFNEFKERIANIGLTDVGILRPIAYWGVTFWDYCLWGGGQLDKLERKIQEILFPEIGITYEDFCGKHRLNSSTKRNWQKWANSKCDVLALLSHIWNGGGIFVTKDKNFQKRTKKTRLIALGAGKILTPKEATDVIKLLSLKCAFEC